MAHFKPKTLKEMKLCEMGRQKNQGKFKLAFHITAYLKVHCTCLLTAVADGSKLRIHLQQF